MENENFIEIEKNGVKHYVNPAFKDTFDINEVGNVSEEEKAEREAAEIKRQAKLYLTETDWYVARKAEVGTPIPEEVLSKRAQARIDASN